MTASSRLLPAPLSVTEWDGEFVVTPRTRIVGVEGTEGVAAWLRTTLEASTGFVLGSAIVADPDDGDAADAGRSDAARSIRLSLDPATAAEGYRLSVTEAGARIAGGDAAGVFAGAQALLQLLPAEVYRRSRVDGVRWAAPCCEVRDAPRFAWRGVLLDVARHFLPKHEVLRFVDLMAMHRLNVLHLHLTDDQGWRIQIRRYPKLTQVSSWRRESQVGYGPDAPGDGRPHGGFYTQDDLREIVAYAGLRGITVVPEVESPGHVQAAIAAYPELGVGGRPLDVGTRWGIIPNVLNLEESTVEFFTNVLDEVVDIFPSPFIGVGGDECVKDQWRADPRTQERMRELGVTSEEGLQSWFISRLDDHLTRRGRRLFGWDEILEGGLAPGATVASWRGETGAIAAARAGHDVVLCPDHTTYLNYRQSERPDEPIPLVVPITVKDVYRFDPVPTELSGPERAHVLGGQANLWTEYMDSPRTLDYFAFPRLCALAEALWSSAPKDYDAFAERLRLHLERLDAVGVEYRHEDGPFPWQTRPGIPGRIDTREQRAAVVAALVANI
ncbi:beta-N-acetylhexosaminidase [Leifsonia poae]|uniref:beta-N-acetylhexosaminidase n=1 Tax=Leifsonia poae TaxID=110933 RepID=UPI001CBDAAFB|nr:beta-N-acetylhexosaminidase [Leifsonia poae]